MSCSTVTDTYACIVRIAGYYAAVQVKEDKQELISNTLQSSVAIAKEVAMIFAKEAKIPFVPKIVKLTKPIVTVVKNESWRYYPATLVSDKMYTMKYEGTLEKVKDEAKNLALKKGYDFNAEIGLCIDSAIIPFN